VIDGTDPFAAAQPDMRLIKLLLRARRFNATLAKGEGVPFAVLAQREGVSRSYFTRLVRLSYLAPDITQAILDGRQPREEAPRALTSAACLVRSADRARRCLSPIRIQRSNARSSPEKAPTSLGPSRPFHRSRHRHCGTGIWPDRDIAAGWRDIETPCASLPTQSPSQPRTPARKAGVLHVRERVWSERQTLRWRELDSNLRFRARAGSILPVRFVADSLLEGDGFELPVPPGIGGSPSWWSRTRKPHGAPERGFIDGGTNSSNPPPSRGESTNHRFRRRFHAANSDHPESHLFDRQVPGRRAW
jgi:hypothetical protein